ncbi:AAA family ATPase [Tamlana sp. 2_MG-2023]|uniref:AAA family ATPase n=1 Tax=unclassified Tamlana TaxID=2614803 RepID=UPI0026E276D0|nr:MULTISPECIES: AAA family ATPase [unclassified Tamlana]MDO6761736.1 AAA family ATPase [Tamlana sp. 2_MG-2023]MDO6792497.1 AAA family ATPase [Tamlana sp. 1_MG-2023]
MITKLNNFTLKSFVGYTNPNDLFFRPKNILFGYNGKGKSSIAIGIKDEFLKDTIKKPENLRLLDKDYISNSLLLENSEGKIKGVEASFSKGDVDIENKIKELEKQIISEVEIAKLETNIADSRKNIRAEIDTIHDRRKGKVGISKKSSSDSVERVIELYKKDFQDAKKIEADKEKLIKIIGDNAIERQIAQYDNLRTLNFSKIPTTLIEQVKAIFTEKFGEDISIPEFEVVQWIESGIKLHKEGDNCKFCDSKLDYSDVKLKIAEYKENKRHKATEKLKHFREQLQSLLDSIRIIEKESKTYSTNIGIEVEQNFTEIAEKEGIIDSLITSCQLKIDNIEIQESFDFVLLAETSKVIEESIFTLTKTKSEKLAELRRKQNNLTTLVKGAIGLEILKSSTIEEKRKEVKDMVVYLKEKRSNNKKKQQEIQDLKHQKSLTKDFADFVSQILNDINISLKVTLDSDNRNYIIKSTNENATLTIKDISEGEKNILALLFFYYELFADNKQQNIKPEIELIIVDDPISSMDDSNKFYILELMKNLLVLQNQQVFVMTHSWDDYCNLSYGKKAWVDKKDKEDNEIKSKYATFEINKNNGKSTLVKSKNLEKPYNYLFKEIYEFSIKSNEDLKTECEIYHYPNVMRRIFEEWYGFKIGRDLNFTSNFQKQIENDFRITSNNQKTKLGLLIKVCNILSHSINGSMNPQEIHQSAKYLMWLIEDKDKLHFDKMKNNN